MRRGHPTATGRLSLRPVSDGLCRRAAASRGGLRSKIQRWETRRVLRQQPAREIDNESGAAGCCSSDGSTRAIQSRVARVHLFFALLHSRAACASTLQGDEQPGGLGGTGRSVMFLLYILVHAVRVSSFGTYLHTRKASAPSRLRVRCHPIPPVVVGL